MMRPLIKVACLVAASLLWILPAVAQDDIDAIEPRRLGLEITPLFGYRFGGSFEDRDTEAEYDLDDNGSFGLAINWPATSYTEWEIYYSKQATSVDLRGFEVTENLIDIDVEYLQIGGTYLFEEVGRYSQPFFMATAGIAKIDPDAPDTRSDTFFSFSVGGGWKFFPTERVGLRLEGRVLGTLLSSDSDIFCKTGPDNNQCAIAVSGDSLYQFEFNAGAIFRF